MLPETSSEPQIDPFATNQPPTEHISRTIEQMTRETLREVFESWYQGLESDLNLKDRLEDYCAKHNLDSLQYAQTIKSNDQEYGLGLELRAAQIGGSSPQDPSRKVTKVSWRVSTDNSWVDAAEAMKSGQISHDTLIRLQKIFLDHQGQTIGFKLSRGAVSIEMNDRKLNEHDRINGQGEVWLQIKNRRFVHYPDGQVYEAHLHGRELLENFELARPEVLDQLRPGSPDNQTSSSTPPVEASALSEPDGPERSELLAQLEREAATGAQKLLELINTLPPEKQESFRQATLPMLRYFQQVNKHPKALYE